MIINSHICLHLEILYLFNRLPAEKVLKAIDTFEVLELSQAFIFSLAANNQGKQTNKDKPTGNQENIQTKN